MISHGKNVKVFCANANRPFAEGVCRKLWLPLGDCTVTTFADGEVSLTINESVRGSDVFLVQSTCKPVNNNLMELLIMIDACRRASAGRITAVIPYFGYARQDRKAKGRDPISAKLVANMIEAAGAGPRADHGSPCCRPDPGLLRHPVDNLLSNPIFVKYYMSKFEHPEEMVVVSRTSAPSPAAGPSPTRWGWNLIAVIKRREKINQCEANVTAMKARSASFFDWYRHTAGSLQRGLCRWEIGGALVHACATTHGVLSGPANERASPTASPRAFDLPFNTNPAARGRL